MGVNLRATRLRHASANPPVLIVPQGASSKGTSFRGAPGLGAALSPDRRRYLLAAVNPVLLAPTGGCGTHLPATPEVRCCERFPSHGKYRHSGSTVLAENPTPIPAFPLRGKVSTAQERVQDARSWLRCSGASTCAKSTSNPGASPVLLGEGEVSPIPPPSPVLNPNSGASADQPASRCLAVRNGRRAGENVWRRASANPP
jgi:hypothetical protein